MNVTSQSTGFHFENAALTRQWLQRARTLSGQCGSGVESLDQNSTSARSECSNLLSDVYSASSDTENTDSSGMGNAALGRLRTLSRYHGEASASASTVERCQEELRQALNTAWSLAGQLGVPDFKSWGVRNPVESAAYDHGQMAGKIAQARSSLSSAESEMSMAQRDASEVAGDVEGANVGYSGQALYNHADEAEDQFGEVSSAAGWAQSHLRSIDSSLDRALAALVPVIRPTAYRKGR